MKNDLEGDINKYVRVWNKLSLRNFKYGDERLDSVLHHATRGHMDSLGNNPYRISTFFYISLYFTLVCWVLGSIVVGHLEARMKIASGQHGALAALVRGFISGIPAIVQITLFLFPPMCVPDCGACPAW